MSLPKFNLSKLRLAVSRQQAVTRKDIANLLLLDRLQSQMRKQSGEQKDLDLPPLADGDARFYVEFYTDNEDGTVEYLDIFHIEPEYRSGYNNAPNFVINEVTEYSKDTLSNIFSKRDIMAYLSNMMYHHNQFHYGGNNSDFFYTSTFDSHILVLIKEDSIARNKINAVYDITIDDGDFEYDDEDRSEEEQLRYLKANLETDFLELIGFQIKNDETDTNLQILTNLSTLKIYKGINIRFKKVEINLNGVIL